MKLFHLLRLYRWHDILVVLMLVILLTACNLPSSGLIQDDGHPDSATATFTPFPLDTQEVQVTGVSESLQQPTNTPEPHALWVAPYLPEQLTRWLSIPEGIQQMDDPNEANMQLLVGDGYPVSHWVYALVAPFPTILDGVASDDVLRSWQGTPSSPFGNLPILVDAGTLEIFTAKWGEPAPEAVKILPTAEMLEYAWDERPAWAIVPFENLEPRWKVLEVGGISPIRKEFQPEGYALTVTLTLDGEVSLVENFINQASEDDQALLGLPAANRDDGKLTTVAMTGVTALVRATAYTMELRGLLYPAEDVGPILREADLTHISNEIPFYPDCPSPNPGQPDLRFCSDPSYIALMDEIGTDIVELTGDHFHDYGPEAMRYTLDLYEQRGWVYYGGGYNLEDGRQARTIEHNGNKFAFIGCNGKGGGYATATDTNPGSVSCDFPWMHAEISRLTDEGYNVITTFQHFEYYSYLIQPILMTDFRGVAEAGAVIVSGSQAHQPHGMEFYEGSFLHYGLGNLFFDQYQFCNYFMCDDTFIDRHVFYEGRYISTELITLKFVDYARPRLMTQSEREQILSSVFQASIWDHEK
ncbi:MAG: CapA family protein [Anaerolineales bacterium]